MFALHLATAPLLRRGMRAITLLRLEAIYYVLLLAAMALPAFRKVMVPAIVLGAIHLIAWAYTEKRPAEGTPRPGLLRAVLVFDTAEAVVLAWIAYRIV
jgi:hypothetical protein